jgi:two-component system cell cycle sensor histidine kinase/response regulator CckA
MRERHTAGPAHGEPALFPATPTTPGALCSAAARATALALTPPLTMMQGQAPPELGPTRRGVSIRGGLLIAFALVVLLVLGSLLTASLLGTARLARDVAGSLMFALGRDTDARLHDLFDPIGQKMVEDYAAIRRGRYSAKDAETRRELLMPGLFSLPDVDSMMLADEKGAHFLIMRYSEPVRRSALLRPVSDRLPSPDPGRLQFLTRDFRPAEWGETSRWALWEDAGRQLVREWNLPLPSYDGRQRPWYKAAMAAFRDQTLPEAQAAASSLVAWTDVYPLFTAKGPSISAAVAARDPSGEILIVTYDLPLDEIAKFTTSARPSPRGMLFVMTDDGRLLGPPRGSRNQADASLPVLQPIAATGSPKVVQSVATWQGERGGRPDRFRLALHGEAWWAGFTPFEFGARHRFWIGVLLPESDLIPAARQYQGLIAAVGLLALLAAALLALRLARWFSKPLAELAAQSRRIASLDLTETAPVRSHLRELDLLSVTLGRMRDALREDISEREQSRREIFKREQEVRALAENSPDIIVRYDREGRYRFANPAFAVATGLSPEKVNGRRISEFAFPLEYVTLWQRTIAEVFASGQSITVEFDLKTPAGLRNFESRAIPELASDGEIASALVVSRDITERVAAARALRRSEERYRTLIESAIVGIVVHQDTHIRYANPAALQMFGYRTAAEFPWQSDWSEHIAPAFRVELHSRTEAVLGGAQVPPHPGWQLLRKDGTHRWVQSSLTRVEWDGADAVLSFMRDITELRDAADRQSALEEQLREAQKLEAVGLLAGGIAHDFNNLLQVIGGNANLALAPDSRNREAALAAIVTAVSQASQLTRQLLTFGRRQALQWESIDLNGLVATHLAMIRRLIAENIRIDFRAAPQPVVTEADKGQMEQVLLNLCLNARDAMPDGGQLSIVIEAVVLDATTAEQLCQRPAGQFARITVSDTGHGMTAAVLERVFEPFFSTKPRDRGSGLGLAVVYGIIRQHGGHIAARSEPGQGTEFVVLLPCETRERAPTEAPSPEPVADDHGSVAATILLAEDNDAVRRVAEKVLSLIGARVIAVVDGLQAVDRFAADPGQFDLLFLDVMMPGLSGFEVAARCRSLRPDIPVLFSSGYAAESLGAKSETAASDPILRKPYDPEALRVAVRRLLANRRAPQSAT